MLMTITVNEMVYFIFFISIFALMVVILVLIIVSSFKKKKKEAQELPMIQLYVDKDGNIVSGNQNIKVSKAPADKKQKEEKKLDFDEALKASSKELKSKYDKLIKYLKGLDEKIKINETKQYVSVKYKTYKICEIEFINDILTASFFVSAPEIKNYDNEVAINEKPTAVDMSDAKALENCFNLADLAFGQAKEAIEIKNTGKDEK